MAYLTNVMGLGTAVKPADQLVAPPPKRVTPVPTKASMPTPTPTQTPVPVATSSKPTILQRAIAGDFGKEAQAMAQAKRGTPVDAGTIGAGYLNVPSVGGTTLPTRGPTTTTGEATPQQLTPQQAIQQRMVELFQDGQNFDATSLMRAEGVYEKELEVSRLNEEYDRMALDQRRTIDAMRENPEGKLAGALNADIQNYQYKSGQALLDQEMRLHYASENYDMAYRRANEAIQAETDRYNKSMQFYTNMYSMLQNDMTESEKMQYGSKLRLYEAEASNLMETKNIAMQRARQNGAPVDVLLGIQNSQSVEDVWISTGSYGEDPELALKERQFGEEMKLAWSKFEWDKWATQQQMSIAQAQKNAEISAKEAQVKAQQVQNQSDAGRSLAAVTAALNNNTGLQAMTGGTTGFTSRLMGALRWGTPGAVGGAAAGTLALPAVGTLGGAIAGFVGSGTVGYNKVAQQQTSFANQMNFITANLTTDRVKEVKANGGWSGVMTDKDIELIGRSADRLSSMWDAEKREFKGNVNPKEVEAGLTEIRNKLANVVVPTQNGDPLSNIFK